MKAENRDNGAMAKQEHKMETKDRTQNVDPDSTAPPQPKKKGLFSGDPLGTRNMVIGGGTNENTRTEGWIKDNTGLKDNTDKTQRGHKKKDQKNL